MKKVNNIMGVLFALLFVQPVFADHDDWDPAGICVLNNYADYENTGSVTAKVYVDGVDVSALGDMIAASVDGELRGVGCAEEVPVFLGNGFAYLTMLYSNATSGETISFQYSHNLSH